MRAGSLRWRLMLGAALTIVVTLTVALFAMSLLFSRHIERRVFEDLQRDANRVIARLHLDARGVPRSLASLSDPRYETPASGRYWQLSSASGNTRSLSLWDDPLPVLTKTSPQQWSDSEIEGPFDQRIILLERIIRVGATGQVRVQFAQDMADLYVAPNQFRWGSACSSLSSACCSCSQRGCRSISA